ncbi:MAG: phytanoyl-CoA dioxygenase family protein [archaeon]|nr:phytanoyl-CoA dioxygenase family protein [archaeon]
MSAQPPSSDRFLGESALKAAQSKFKLATDEEGFVKGFDPDDSAGIKAFFDEWGFVVTRGVISAELCDAVVQEFWETGKPPQDPDKPETWDAFWEAQMFRRMGIVGNLPQVRKPRLLDLRQQPNLHKVYASVHHEEELWVDHDRLGVMRPTQLPSGPRPDWKTLSSWLHIDCNPVSGMTDVGSFDLDSSGPERMDFEANLYVQGFVALTDARLHDGGFHCVPGSPCLIDLYLDRGGPGAGNIQIGRPGHPIWDYVHRLPVRKGSSVIWNSLTLHGNYPNDSDRFRMVAYARMLPHNRGFTPLIHDAQRLPEGFVLTALGHRLFGLPPAAENPSSSRAAE